MPLWAWPIGCCYLRMLQGLKLTLYPDGGGGGGGQNETRKFCVNMRMAHFWLEIHSYFENVLLLGHATVAH